MKSEEEIIKNIKSFINAIETYGTIDYKCIPNLYEPVVGLLDLYQKEKEKNKKLEIELEIKKYCKVNELAKDLIYYKNLAKEYQGNCISKDKIRKCIQTPYPELAVENIVELLEEGKQRKTNVEHV